MANIGDRDIAPIKWKGWDERGGDKWWLQRDYPDLTLYGPNHNWIITNNELIM